MRTVEDALGLWVSGLLSSEGVVARAERELARLAEPPMELFSLASDGPEKCLKRSEAEFPYRPTQIGYAHQFAIRAISVDLASNEDLRHLANWTARNCIGEDLSEPFAKLGYRLDHYISDCQNTDGAIALLREYLPSLLAQCHLLASAYDEADA